jgi:hypothetical protein
MRDSLIAIALMVFGGRSPGQGVAAESLNASRNLRESPVRRRRFQTVELTRRNLQGALV